MSEQTKRLRAAADFMERASGERADWLHDAANEIDRLRKALSACAGYMLNAKIDIEGRTPKRTTLNTLEGGIRMAKEVLNPSAER